MYIKLNEVLLEINIINDNIIYYTLINCFIIFLKIKYEMQNVETKLLIKR